MECNKLNFHIKMQRKGDSWRWQKLKQARKISSHTKRFPTPRRLLFVLRFGAMSNFGAKIIPSPKIVRIVFAFIILFFFSLYSVWRLRFAWSEVSQLAASEREWAELVPSISQVLGNFLNFMLKKKTNRTESHVILIRLVHTNMYTSFHPFLASFSGDYEYVNE